MNSSGGTLLIESVQPTVRKVLVRERVRAMQGCVDNALDHLSQAIAVLDSGCVRETVVLGTLRAELLHLDRRHVEALQDYRNRVVPMKRQLDVAQQFVVDQNLADLEFSALSPEAAKTFYALVDRRNLAGFEWYDAHDIIEAYEAAASGKHYEALPIFWRHAVQAYRQGCWLISRLATKRLAEESLQIGSLIEAGVYAVLSHVSEVLEKVAEAVMRRRDIALVGDLVRRLITTANLRRHFSAACELLYLIGDAIQQDDLATLVEWLLPRCGELPDGAGKASALNMAWQALEPIAHRLHPDLARRAFEAAFAHPVWNTQLDNPNALILERQQMVKTVNHLVAAADRSDLGRVAEQSLPLALDRRQMHDYGDTINLLCHVADRGGSEIKARIGTALLAPGKALDRLLIQVTPRFRDELADSAQIAALADNIAREITLQVQYVEKGQAVTVPETVFTFNNTRDNRIQVVSMVGGIGIHAVARHRHRLAREPLMRLIRAATAMARERENFLGNRRMLLGGLIGLADCVGLTLRTEVCEAIESLAKGIIQEPLAQPAAKDASNPLNPYRFDLGKVADVRSMALMTLAEFARFDPKLTQKYIPVFEDAIYDEVAEVRRGAYGALAKLPQVSEPILLAVLIGTRDQEADVAAAAFFALSRQPGWDLTRSHWRLLLHSCRLARQYPAELVRRNAAAALAALVGRAPTRAIREGLEAVRLSFRADICASVRSMADAAGVAGA